MLYQEKAQQAEALLREIDLDCWLTFVRETAVTPDPGVELVVGANVTWPSAFIIGRNGERIAIVGRYDADPIREMGIFPEVITYDQGIRTELLNVLQRLNPSAIGLNYSIDDKTADGLTHGMWLLLQQLLEGTPFSERLTSAASLLSKLRARKIPTEVHRIQEAIRTTETIVDDITHYIKIGMNEKQIGDFIHDKFHQHGVDSSWSWDACPIVNSGPDSAIGHSRPNEAITVEPGHLVHIDLGVRQDEYCSDIQRMWYVRRPGETEPPPELQRAFHTVLQAIEASAAALKPGVQGYEIDAIAREVVVDAGYEEYMHALGHGLGRACHDGGTMLGPRWERYGATPEGIVEVGNVYTLELGVMTSAGYVGLEEDVVVTAYGCEFLSTLQRELLLI